jgi:hypothetical protein
LEGRAVVRRRLAAGVSAILWVVAVSPAGQAEPLNIETWPDDVPCDVLKKHPDGTYEMTVPWVRYFTIHSGGTWKNTRETRYWDQHCKGKTQ